MFLHFVLYFLYSCTLVFYVSEKKRRKEEKEFIMNRETRVHGVQD